MAAWLSLSRGGRPRYDRAAATGRTPGLPRADALRPLLLALVVLLAGWSAAGAGQSDSSGAAGHQAPPLYFTVSADPEALSAVEERFGVQVIGLRLAAGGYMLDFRYRVVDAAKAKPLVGKDVTPYLLDPQTGAKTVVPASPKFGALKPISGEPLTPGRNYFMMFANPGKRLGQGREATVVIGDFKAERLVIN